MKENDLAFIVTEMDPNPLIPTGISSSAGYHITTHITYSVKLDDDEFMILALQSLTERVRDVYEFLSQDGE